MGVRMSEKYWLGDDEGITFTPSGTNTAYTAYADTVPREMTDHSRTMNPGVFTLIGKNVHQIFGYALSALTLVEGDDGLILIDPAEDVEKAKLQLEQIRKISDKPIKAVVYSHWHTDHYAGVKAFITDEQAASGEVKVIAHRDFMDNVIANSASGDGPITGARLDYSLGTLLEVGPEGRVNGGLGPDVVMRTVSLVRPNTPVDDRLEHTVAGVRMVHFWAPSEAVDEIVTWFPDLGVLQSAEVIQGESFPNLHSIRGTRYRDPQAWFKSIDKHLRPLPADFMIPSHGRPVSGREQVAKVLRDYRDAISYVYDQTMRWINRGPFPMTWWRRSYSPQSWPKANGWAISTAGCRTPYVRSTLGSWAGSMPTRPRSRRSTSSKPLAATSRSWAAGTRSLMRRSAPPKPATISGRRNYCDTWCG
jgi:alkyl sulfatase BDS1-like metallo-beta-lactamase superfamily hydrolase